jgi:hypothetical protein
MCINDLQNSLAEWLLKTTIKKRLKIPKINHGFF